MYICASRLGGVNFHLFGLIREFDLRINFVILCVLACFNDDDVRVGVFGSLGGISGTLGGETVDVLFWYFSAPLLL